jgi:hypothetical protein
MSRKRQVTFFFSFISVAIIMIVIQQRSRGLVIRASIGAITRDVPAQRTHRQSPKITQKSTHPSDPHV